MANTSKTTSKPTSSSGRALGEALIEAGEAKHRELVKAKENAQIILDRLRAAGLLPPENG